ncbi:MAG: lipase, partial [Oscillospiraceae bacterium]|nr:lipase [Oscillospiraceae bacterium]
MSEAKKWVSVWGNAVSVAENRPERYAKDITIRYPINIPFDGEGIRLTFDNYCGTEPITLTKVTVFYGGEFYPVTYMGQRSISIGAGERIVTDPLAVKLRGEELVQVSFYLGGFTLMRSVVYACGPLSEGLYANGDQTETAHID